MSSQDDPGLSHLLGCVANVMQRWCWLEDELAGAIARLRTESEGEQLPERIRGSFSGRLSELRQLLAPRIRRDPEFAGKIDRLANKVERLRALRNLIVHDQVGATADTDKGEPHISCKGTSRGWYGVERRITLSDLTAMIGDLEDCRNCLRTIDR